MVLSLIAAIEDAEGTATKTFSNLTFESGKTSKLDLTTDLVRPVRLQLTVSAEHSYENNVLTGTNVTLGLGVDEAELNGISNINITVQAGNNTYRTYSADNVSETSIDLNTGNLYLPNSAGTYTVNCSYVDKNFGPQESTTTFTTPKPNVNLTGSASVNGKVITVSKAEVAISDQVLSEYPMEYARMQIGISGSYTTYTSSFKNQSSVFTNLEHTCDKSGTFLVRVAAKFDGVDSGYIDINSFNITVDDKYQVVSTVSEASQIKDGGLYVIRVWTGDDKDKYWKVASPYRCTVEINSEATFTKEYVFRYDKGDNTYIKIKEGDSDSGIKDNYKSISAGALTSLYNNKFPDSGSTLSEIAFDTTYEPWKLYFVFANKWDNYVGDDIDIYKQNTGIPLYYNSSNYRLTWGTEGGVDSINSYQRKWTLIEVKLVE